MFSGTSEMNDMQRRPKLYIWKNSRLYIGISHLPFRRYTLAWSQLLVSVKGSMRIQLESGAEVVSKTCMIKAGTVVSDAQVNTSNSVIAIYYFNPISQDFYILQNNMSQARDGVCYDHPAGDMLIRKLCYILNETLSSDEACQLIQDVIVPAHLRSSVVKNFDPRIIKIVLKLRDEADENLPISAYANDVNLSESRLNKLFKDQIGIPITKYRLQLRLSIGIILLAAGYKVTEAAYEAGFSSSAHFSTCFSDMIGVPPSTPFLRPPFIDAHISEDLLRLITGV